MVFCIRHSIINLLMDFFKILYDELISFFGLGKLIDLFQSGDYSSLRSLEGIVGVLSPLIPLLLLIEIIRAFINRKSHSTTYRISFLIIVFNRVVSRFISFGIVGLIIGLLGNMQSLRPPLPGIG